MAKFGIGQGMKRFEDQRFLTGTGQYTDDMPFEGVLKAFVLRSQIAHGDITTLDVSAAKKLPGVKAVLTGADVVADGLNPLPCGALLKGKDGKRAVATHYPLLVTNRVRHVGDAVALIVAETMEQARDAAELIEVDYAELPAIPGLAAAEAPGAQTIWDEAAGNLCLDWVTGDAEGVSQRFAKAAHVA